MIIDIFLLGKYLVGSESQVIGSPIGDGADQFLYWRKFGFEQLRHGHLSLWNPYAFSGTPFLGGWQSGLLYPPDWIYLVLPLERAMNFEMALHIFWLGAGVAMWARYHQLHPLACLVAAITASLGGTVFLRLFAGHLSIIDTASWVPWIFCAFDQILDNPQLKAALLLTLSTAMAILGGHPQTVFNASITLIIYLILRSISSTVRARSILIIVMGGFAAVLITAVQIAAGLAAAAEGTRQAGVPYAFAASISFPPENFVTLIVPWFFGGIFSYWGESYIWEASIFCGVTGSFLALYAAAFVKNKRKPVWCAMVVLLMVLALAANTPLFPILYHYVPGFNRFRGDSKFDFDATLFVSMLAAVGLDELLTRPIQSKKVFLFPVIFLAGLLMAYTVLKRCITLIAWEKLCEIFAANAERENILTPLNIASFAAQSRLHSEAALIIAAIPTLLILGILAAARYRRRVLYAIPVIAICEMFWFAQSSISTFDIRSTVPPFASQLEAIGQADHRVLRLDDTSNFTMSIGTPDIWGYDPTVTNRYAEFMYFTQGLNPNDADEYLSFHLDNPLFRLLRCSDVIMNSGAGPVDITHSNAFSHIFFVKNYLVLPNRDGIFRLLRRPSMNPGKTMLLESRPFESLGAVLGGGTASITSNTSDQSTVVADNASPGILLITDNYSRDITAAPLSGDTQRRYKVLPADYTLIGVPLTPGHHVFTLIYRPRWFEVSAYISIVSISIFLGVCLAELIIEVRLRRKDIGE